jgi:hypothetical protein
MPDISANVIVYRIAFSLRSRVIITIPSVGSQFATQKSGVVGTVQEVIANANGSYRIKLDVAVQPRWTTAK